GHGVRFRRPMATLQRRMIVPPLTLPRVELGTIARRKAGAPTHGSCRRHGPARFRESRRRDGPAFARGHASLWPRFPERPRAIRVAPRAPALRERPGGAWESAFKPVPACADIPCGDWLCPRER